MVSIAGKVVPKWVIALIAVSTIASVVVALVMFGQYKISYLIQPAAEAPTLTPNPVPLDLGTIASGSTGEKDFGNTATLSLPAGYEITFELDTTTIGDFDDFDVTIRVYEAGTTNYVTTLYLYDWLPTDSHTFGTGDYDLYVKVDYTAKSVTTSTSGTVVITLSWPG
jgi:hypothetical protein